MSNHYKTLGVSPQATPEEIKKAFRRLAYEHHPDRAKGDTDRMKEINVAYDTLKDPVKKRDYDLSGAFRSTRGAGPSGKTNADPGGSSNYGFWTNFEDIFGGSRQASGQKPDYAGDWFSDKGPEDEILEKDINEISSSDIAYIGRLIEDPWIRSPVKRTLVSKLTSLVKRDQTLAPQMTGIAIAEIECEVGESLFDALIAEAPNAFGPNDIISIGNLIDDPMTRGPVKRSLVSKLTSLVKRDQTLAPQMTGIAISAIEYGAGESLFDALIAEAPNAFGSNDVLHISNIAGDFGTTPSIKKVLYRKLEILNRNGLKTPSPPTRGFKL